MRYGVHDPRSAANVRRGIESRVFRVEGPNGLCPPPKPNAKAWKRLEWLAVKIAKPLVGAVRMSRKQFLEQCPDRTRARYTQASSEVIREGLTVRDCRVQTFTKYEKINFWKKADPAPRVIQPRSAKYNYCLGRFTRVVEHDLYLRMDELWSREEGERTVIKGVSVQVMADILRAKWDHYGQHAVCIGIDAKRFDQHVSQDALRWEHKIYTTIFNDHPELVWLLKQQLRNKGCCYVEDVKIEYTTDGCRMSGDMNTGLGNTLIMCALLFVYKMEKNLDCRLGNNGDDAVLFMDRRNIEQINDMKVWFLQYGFQLELEEPVYIFEEVEFCQTKPVLTSVGWKMVRSLDALSKDLLCLGCATERELSVWMYNVGKCGSSLYGDIPIFSEFYKNFTRFGTKGKPTRLFKSSGMYYNAKLATEVGIITPECRASFYFATGICPDEQVAVEGAMRQLERGSWTTMRGEWLHC